MSVNIAERPTFEKKRAVHFDRGVFASVICLVLIFTSKAEFLNLIVSVNGHCIS